ncbi:universal stress protein [Lactiplantibacillus pentosus]
MWNVARVLIGSNAAYVIRNAACDTLVVRTDEDQQPVKFTKRSTRQL